MNGIENDQLYQAIGYIVAGVFTGLFGFAGGKLSAKPFVILAKYFIENSKVPEDADEKTKKADSVVRKAVSKRKKKDA